jgi:hypothetical protein
VNTEDLRALAERAETVTGRQGARLAEVHGRIQTARRRRGAAAAAGSAAVVLALVVGVTLLADAREQADRPIHRPTPIATTPTETVEIPAGQVTVTPDIRPGDARGWKTVGSRTNTQPGRVGVTELSMTVRKYFGDGGDGTYIGWFCHASPDTGYAYSYGDGAGGVGYCSLNDPLSPPPPARDLGPSTFQFLPESLPVRMYVFKATKAQKECLKRNSPGECHVRRPASTDATFGFAIHEHRATRAVLHLGKDLGFEVGHLEDPLDFAALVIQGGQEYLLEEAVVPAPGANRLVVRLDASDRERLIGVFSVANKRSEACGDRYQKEHRLPGSKNGAAERALAEAAAKFCNVEYSLKVDDNLAPVSADFSEFGEPWMNASAGARQVTVDVARGDPRNERLAVVIWKARP